MEQSTINQRLKFLVSNLAKSSREFSLAINESPTNTSNYTGNRGTEPRAEYLTKVLHHFGKVNARWLMTGEGEAFGPEVAEANSSASNNKRISHSLIVGQAGRDAIQSQGASATELATAKREIEFLKAQVTEKERVIESKDEVIQLLKASLSKP